MKKHRKNFGFAGDSKPTLDLASQRLSEAKAGASAAFDPSGLPKLQSSDTFSPSGSSSDSTT